MTFQHTVASLFLTMLICAGHYVNEMLRWCSLICMLLVNHMQKFPLPSALF